MRKSTAINPQVENLARHMFATYNSVNAQTFDGRPVPTWEEIAARESEQAIEAGLDIGASYLPGGTRAKWYAAAQAAVVAFHPASWDSNLRAKLLAADEYLFDGNAERVKLYEKYAPER